MTAEIGSSFKLSFNPRARDGREKGCIYEHRLTYVSIHAPVMDAKRTG